MKEIKTKLNKNITELDRHGDTVMLSESVKERMIKDKIIKKQKDETRVQ
jgi:hypothetical protein